MKVALVTTTIYVPRVLALYRAIGPDVAIFVAGDRKTPHDEVRSFLDGIGNAVYLSDADQEKLGYACSEIIGWNKIMRRNLALLEAIRSGADVIISVDDDNLPLSEAYFDEWVGLFSKPFRGPSVTTDRGWFDVGAFLEPPVHHRGFPYEHRHADLGLHLSAASDVEIGVAAGLWLGDPDIDAMERLTNQPLVRHVSDVLHGGIVVENGCYAPYNTQNTAIRGELAPLLMVLTGVGRYDDIWASYIAQRILFETPYRVHFGKPLVWQDRNPQNLWRNLRDELLGMEVGARFAEDLRGCRLEPNDVLGNLRRIYEAVKGFDYVPAEVHELGFAWCEDVERALGTS